MAGLGTNSISELIVAITRLPNCNVIIFLVTPEVLASLTVNGMAPLIP